MLGSKGLTVGRATRRSSEDIAASERQLRAVFESAIDFAIVVTDRDGTVTDWNTGAEHVFGWSADDMIGSDAERFFTPEDRLINQPRREMQAALETGRGIDERWHLRQDGSRFWGSGEMMVLRDDDENHLGFLKIVRDRTEQHLAGVQLRQLEEQLRQAQEAGGVGLFTVEVATGLLTATPAFSALFGLEHQTERPAQDFERRVVEEDQDLVSNNSTRRRGGAPRDVEYRIHRADTGELRWIARKGEFQLDGNGEPVRFAGIARDVTDAKQSALLREALHRLDATLIGMADPKDMPNAAAQVIGEALGVGRVGYGAVGEDGETFTVPRDWTKEGYPSLAGTYRISDYGLYADDLRRGDTVVIPDIRTDHRTADNTQPLEQLGVRTLVNHPVVEGGRTVAILYVNDAAARDWTAEEVGFVQDAAARTRGAIERRRAEDLLVESNERQRLALSLGEVGLFDLDMTSGELLWDDHVRAAFGVLGGRRVTQAEKLAAVHADDRASFDAAVQAAMQGEVFDQTFRAVGLDDGVTRWVAVQGTVIAASDGRRHFIGAVRDVTDTVAADERRKILNAELAHRLKNNLALVTSIANQTLRTAPDLASARATLMERIQALSKAHDVLMTGQREAASIQTVVLNACDLLDGDGRVTAKGPDIRLGPKASLTLSLIVHELSTNAAKHGALSIATGRVAVSWHVSREAETRRSVLEFEWRELDGPAVAPPTRRSFGTRLIEMGMSGTVGGTSELIYAPDGLVCRMRSPLVELMTEDEA